MLSEGDIFEIRIPLKKSDINLQKSDIESKKSDISLQKSDIENEKLSEEYLMQKCKQYSYNITVLNNMRALYASINTNQIFGASDIERILGCARSTASDNIKRMRDMNVVVSVTNHGKGKYRLINKNEIL